MAQLTKTKFGTIKINNDAMTRVISEITRKSCAYNVLGIMSSEISDDRFNFIINLDRKFSEINFHEIYSLKTKILDEAIKNLNTKNIVITIATN